jgi:TPR repeat protein
MFYLGVAHRDGEGVAKSAKAAVVWFAKAALQGHSNAQFNLGVCYELGEGVAQDFLTAASWYDKADRQDFVGATAACKRCYKLLAEQRASRGGGRAA